MPENERFKARFHFGIDYKPNLAINVIGSYGLPCPPGLGGSAVWNMRFVESRSVGEPWTPACARITGIVWGWPSDLGCIIATRAEYVWSFLFSASERLANRDISLTN